jgi:hypothetical protein
LRLAQTAAELADDLRRWLNVAPIRARRIGPVGRTVRWCRRSPALSATVIIALLTMRREVANAIAARTQAEEAQDVAVQERNRARASREQALDALTDSLYQQARARLASHEPGRRWQTLELLRNAEQLRNRIREGTDSGTRQADSATVDQPAMTTNNLTEKLPDRAELRSEPVAALLLPDARMLREWQFDVFTSDLAVSADGSRSIGDHGRSRACPVLPPNCNLPNSRTRWRGGPLLISRSAPAHSPSTSDICKGGTSNG